MGSDSAYGEPFYKEEHKMREIVFRGKRISDGKWLYGSLENHLFRKSADKSPVTYILSPDIEPDYYSFECFDNIDCEVDPKTVGQYVGVVSKNGKRIFEGDVVESLLRGVVVFEYGKFGFKDYLNDRLWSLGMEPVSGSLVIGNIHDNPELLEDR